MADAGIRIVIDGQDNVTPAAHSAARALDGLQRAASTTASGMAKASMASSDAARGITQTGAAARSSSSAIDGIRNSMLGFMGATGALGMIGSLFNGLKDAAIGFNAQMEQSRVAWDVLLGGADKAQVMLTDLQQFAAKTPFEFPEVESAARRLIAMGFAARDALAWMTDIGNVASGMGKGAEGMNRIVLALGQMQAKGKVAGGELLQLTDVGVSTSQIFDIMAQQTGKSVDELRKMQEQGNLTAAAFLSAFQVYARNNFGSMMERQSRTFNGVMSTIRDNLRLTAASAFEPLFAKISELALRFSDLISSEAFTNFGKDVGHVVSQIISAFTSLSPPIQQAIMLIAGLSAAVLGVAAVVAIAGPAIAAGFTLMTGPVGIAIAAIGALYVAYTTNLLGIKDWVDKNAPKILDGLIDAVDSVIDLLMPIMNNIGAFFSQALAWLADMWNTYGESIISILRDVFNLLSGNLKGFMDTFGEIWGAGLDALSGNWNDAWIHINKAAITAWDVMIKNAKAVTSSLLDMWSWTLEGLAKLYEAGATGPFEAMFRKTADAIRATTKTIGQWKGGIQYATVELDKFVHKAMGFQMPDLSPFNDDVTEAGHRIVRTSGALRNFMTQVREWYTRPTKQPSWADINRGVLPGPKPPAPPAPPPLPELPPGGGGGAAATRDTATAVRELAQAMASLHPATVAAAQAVAYWESQIKSVNLAIAANQDQLKAAQADLGRMQDHLQALQRELDVAKQKLTEFSQPRLTGMTLLERQINAVQEQLKRIQLAKLLGVPLSEIVRRFPRLTAGMEDYLNTLPTTERGLSKVLEQLQLMQSLSFDEKMRLLGEAAQGTVQEMDFSTAMAGTLQYRAEVDRLTAAIQTQEEAIRNQEAVIKSIQANGEALNATLATYQRNLEVAKTNQDSVTNGLQMAYQWLLLDRDQMLALGGTATTMVPIIDEQMRTLLQGMDQFALQESGTVDGAITTLYNNSKALLDEINAKVQALNTTVVTTHIINTVYTTNDEGIPGRAAGGSVTANRPYIVGEQGRELFVPRTSGQIVSHAALAQDIGGIDYARLAAAMASQPLVIEMDGERVALAVRQRLIARGAGSLGR